jgi:hypothetical protein
LSAWIGCTTIAANIAIVLGIIVAVATYYLQRKQSISLKMQCAEDLTCKIMVAIGFYGVRLPSNEYIPNPNVRPIDEPRIKEIHQEIKQTLIKENTEWH